MKSIERDHLFFLLFKLQFLSTYLLQRLKSSVNNSMYLTLYLLIIYIALEEAGVNLLFISLYVKI
jgi:hypothetical protein